MIVRLWYLASATIIKCANIVLKLPINLKLILAYKEKKSHVDAYKMSSKQLRTH